MTEDRMTEDLAKTERIAPSTCVVRDTASRKGRTRAVEPGTTAARHLHYGRIILDATDTPVTFGSGDCETVLICLGGTATVVAEGQPVLARQVTTRCTCRVWRR